MSDREDAAWLNKTFDEPDTNSLFDNKSDAHFVALARAYSRRGDRINVLEAELCDQQKRPGVTDDVIVALNNVTEMYNNTLTNSNNDIAHLRQLLKTSTEKVAELIGQLRNEKAAFQTLTNAHIEQGMECDRLARDKAIMRDKNNELHRTIEQVQATISRLYVASDEQCIKLSEAQRRAIELADARDADVKRIGVLDHAIVKYEEDICYLTDTINGLRSANESIAHESTMRNITISHYRRMISDMCVALGAAPLGTVCDVMGRAAWCIERIKLMMGGEDMQMVVARIDALDEVRYIVLPRPADGLWPPMTIEDCKAVVTRVRDLESAEPPQIKSDTPPAMPRPEPTIRGDWSGTTDHIGDVPVQRAYPWKYMKGPDDEPK